MLDVACYLAIYCGLYGRLHSGLGLAGSPAGACGFCERRFSG